MNHRPIQASHRSPSILQRISGFLKDLEDQADPLSMIDPVPQEFDIVPYQHHKASLERTKQRQRLEEARPQASVFTFVFALVVILFTVFIKLCTEWIPKLCTQWIPEMLDWSWANPVKALARLALILVVLVAAWWLIGVAGFSDGEGRWFYERGFRGTWMFDRYSAARRN
jgi:hypothetical protein